MRSAVVIGIGEMGGVFSRALLRHGVVVVPVLRSSQPDAVAGEIAEPELALITVAEDDLDATLASLPAPWRARAGLIQNELLPRDWEKHDIDNPTVAVVWFEKKPGREVAVIMPTPVAGPAAGLLVAALDSIGIPATEITASRLVDSLVVKNLYILTANIAGMRVGGSVGALWRDHRDLATAVAGDVLDIQQHLVPGPLDREWLLSEMVAAFAADPDHGATGRSAPRRLQRAIAAADAAGLPVPALRAIAQDEGLIT
jgi:hypothetical protein